MNDVEQVRAVGKLLEKPENRIRFTEAEDANGHSVSASSPYACKFCLFGAVARVACSMGLDRTKEEGLVSSSPVYVSVSRYLVTPGTLMGTWDDAADYQQEAIVQKLLKYNA